MEKRKLTKGITLIALVVTIVVLLILAGITISLVFGQNGVIKKAQDSKEETAIGEMREKLEMAKVPVYADGNGSYKVEDYWDRIESEGLIVDKEVDKIDNGDGTYEVTTVPGYVFEITVEPNEEIADNIIIGECIGKGENLSIGLRVVNKTTNSIEIELVRAEGASDFKYSIKKQGEEYGEAQASEATTYTFSGLTQGGIYTIKVEATKDGEQQVVERTVQVGEIPKAIKGTVEWTGNGQAQVRIYTEEDGYQLEWQKNNITEGSWTREAEGVKEKTITGLVNGDKIYARLYDGISSGEWANIQVMDNEAPMITKFEVTEVTFNSINVEVEANDVGSGLINTSTYRFYLNDETQARGTSTDGTYQYNELTISDKAISYKIKVEVYDNAGNKAEKIIENVSTNPAIMKIYTKEDMEKFREVVNSGFTYECYTVELMNDIDLQGSESNQWETIGDYEKNTNNGFNGTFEGNNHTISNLYINKPTKKYVGLFSFIKEKAEVKNVKLEGKVIGDYMTGGLVGASFGKINACINKVNIKGGGAGCAGGIARMVITNSIYYKLY